MSKAYSNKALPAGTVLREWRLEDVLGVGGFGIVYKAKGIYFGELVAIKEYFPSSISERDAEATVVPIDSDAEEVHALGLKKFVEEAKLLWNLSTPTRHPNIVSVRSRSKFMAPPTSSWTSRTALRFRRCSSRATVSTRRPSPEHSPGRRGTRPCPPRRSASPRHQAAEHPGQRERPSGPDRFRLGSVRDRGGDQHQGHLPHPALRGARTICEKRSPGAVDRHLCARRGRL